MHHPPEVQKITVFSAGIATAAKKAGCRQSVT
jgi:hypothetical protein